MNKSMDISNARKLIHLSKENSGLMKRVCTISLTSLLYTVQRAQKAVTGRIPRKKAYMDTHPKALAYMDIYGRFPGVKA
jgi:hypothetical protein